MNKKEAAAYLGISTRTLEYHQKKKRISVRYEKGLTGDEAIYDEAELRKLKAALQKPTRATSAAVAPGPEPAQGLETLRGSIAGPVAASSPEALAAFVQVIAAHLPDRLDEELFSLPQAAKRSGVPVSHLRRAVQTGTLKTVAIGGGYGKVKRSDLNRFVREIPER